MLSTIRPSGLDDPNNIKPNLFFIKSRFGREDAFLSKVDLLAFEYARSVDQSQIAPKGRTTASNSKYGQLSIDKIVTIDAMKEYVREIYALDIETPLAQDKEARAEARKERQKSLFGRVFPQDVPSERDMDTSEGQGPSEQLSVAQDVQEKILATRMKVRFKEAGEEVLDKAKFFELRLQDEADLIEEEDDDDDSDVEADGSESEDEGEVVTKPKRKKKTATKIDPNTIPSTFFPSVDPSFAGPSQETDVQKLLRVGAVVVDIMNVGDSLDRMLSQLVSFSPNLTFTAKRAINSWEGVPSPMAFHGEEVVRVRELLLAKMKDMAKLANKDLFGEGNQYMKAEPLFGALVVHNGAGGGRSMTRSNKQRNAEINLSGFINIGNTYQDFVFVEASYVVGKKKSIPQAEFSKAESIGAAVFVPPGKAVVYFDTLIHSNNMQTARTFDDPNNLGRQARLYAGLRLYNTEDEQRRLQGDPENIVKKGIVPAHVFGPEYRVFRQINFDEQIAALTANMLPQTLDDGKPKLKTPASELMASLAEMGFELTQVEGRADLYATQELIDDGVKDMETTTTASAPLFSIIP